ncbi:uncharacterized protein [Argopecten irradians]|uniref:uncharacterized protein n=1 Tax=Argopecten irradians TaxID=31199 RepID=UPI00371BD812
MAKRNQRGLQTLAQGSLVLARTHATEAVLKNIEDQLEKELEREESASTSAKPLARVRHKGQKFLHSKHILLIIVGLNVLDCILVLGELILDVHFIVDLLDKSDKQSQHFMDAIEEKYPDVPPVHDIDSLYSRLIHANISWGNQSVGSNSSVTLRHHRKRNLASQHGYVFENQKGLNVTIKKINEAQLQNAHAPAVKNDPHHHSIEEEVAHGLHKASITILAILVIETGIKVFCEGRGIFHRKVEVFDSIIVVVSFTLDLVFIKGLTMFPIQKYVFILAFLVPWRVIRVVNSLIVAVMDHGHFRLKLLYSQKKKISASLKTTKQELKTLRVGMENVRKLCSEAGIPEWKLQQCLDVENNNHNSSKPHTSLAFLSSKSPLKRPGSETKPEVNGGRKSSTSSKDEDIKAGDQSGVILYNIEESNESTGLMGPIEKSSSP